MMDCNLLFGKVTENLVLEGEILSLHLLNLDFQKGKRIGRASSYLDTSKGIKEFLFVAKLSLDLKYDFQLFLTMM